MIDINLLFNMVALVYALLAVALAVALFIGVMIYMCVEFKDIIADRIALNRRR